jgi:Phosphopantetheine attachment site
MIPKAMDSLEIVEAVMLIEEVFGTEIPDGDAETFGSPREMVDWLELHLSNQRPSKGAAALLKKLAKAHNNPELAEGLEGTWRREQIAAIVREMFHQ